MPAFLGMVATVRVSGLGILRTGGAVPTGALAGAVPERIELILAACMPAMVFGPPAPAKAVRGGARPPAALGTAGAGRAGSPSWGGLTVGWGAARATGAGVSEEVLGGGSAFGTEPASAIFSNSSRKAAICSCMTLL